MEVSGSTSRVSKRLVILTILFVTAIVVLYSLFTGAYEVLFYVKPLYLLVALLIYFFSWFVSAVRLMYLHSLVNNKDKLLSIKEYFNARILGGLMAYLTPSAIGGEPARAYYLSLKSNEPFSKFFALTIYEVFYDIIIINVLAIGFSIYKYPLTIPVIIVGLTNLCSWIIIYYILNNIIKPDKANPIIGKILEFIEKTIISRIKKISEGYFNFGLAFNTISRKTCITEKIVIISLTFLIHLINVLAISVIGLSVKQSCECELFLAAFTSYFYSSTLGSLPIPGGAGVVEYGLSISLAPSIVLISRTLMYYSVVILGFIILLKTKVIRELIK
ncbi:MAG: hypothetical protein B6U89_01725 [Desulfurococcales archaeon ex4484_58]|nr:MAG: hypothetical protein B6U89_01725 [Desulfurococcales archaeon ex4484_58]